MRRRTDWGTTHWLWGMVGTLALGSSVTLSLCAARGAGSGKPAKVAVDDSFTPSVAQQVIESGDTLWNITDKVSGKPWLWPKVWAMNPEITNPHWIYPGDIIRFTPSSEAGPGRAELVASSMDIPQQSDAAAEKALNGPKVEVVNTAPPPSRRKRELPQRVYDGLFVTSHELAESGRLTNAIPDKVMLRPADLLFVRFPKADGAKPGDRFMLYRTVREVEHPLTHKKWGYMTEITGTATVQEVDKDVARARLDTASREVERGQYVTPLTTDLMVSVDVVPAKAEVHGVVLAVEGNHITVGEQKLVFVDKGKGDGLERGNQLKIQTVGDPLIDGDEKNLPGIDVATLLVVDAKDNTATCLVVDSLLEVNPGDPVHSVGAAR